MAHSSRRDARGGLSHAGCGRNAARDGDTAVVATAPPRADGIIGWKSAVSPIAGVASPEGARPALASPAISPRRFRGRHRALCIARLSAGLRTRGRGRGEYRVLLLVAASQGRAPVRVATSFPPTAAGQCRDGIIRSAPASLFIRRRKPTEPTATTYRGWSGWSTLHIQTRAAKWALPVARRRPPRSRQAGCDRLRRLADIRMQASIQTCGSRRRERVGRRRSQPRPTTDARDVSALSFSRCRTFRSTCIIPYRLPLPQFPLRPRALPSR